MQVEPVQAARFQIGRYLLWNPAQDAHAVQMPVIRAEKQPLPIGRHDMVIVQIFNRRRGDAVRAVAAIGRDAKQPSVRVVNQPSSVRRPVWRLDQLLGLIDNLRAAGQGHHHQFARLARQKSSAVRRWAHDIAWPSCWRVRNLVRRRSGQVNPDRGPSGTARAMCHESAAIFARCVKNQTSFGASSPYHNGIGRRPSAGR